MVKNQKNASNAKDVRNQTPIVSDGALATASVKNSEILPPTSEAQENIGALKKEVDNSAVNNRLASLEEDIANKRKKEVTDIYGRRIEDQNSTA